MNDPIRRIAHYTVGMSNPAGKPEDGARPLGSGDDTRWRAPSLRVLITAATACLSFACQWLPVEEDQQPAAAPEPAPAPSEVRQPEPQLEPSLAEAMDLLQRGREEGALRMLDALGESGPVVASLRRQILEPVEELIPGPYRRVEVQPGETLSQIAERELGDPLMFYALARLNEIAEPRLVAVGQALRVPVASHRSAPEQSGSEPPSGGPVAPVAATARDRDVATVIDYLLRTGESADAWRMLVLETESGSAGPEMRDSLVALTLARADEQQREGRFERALDELSRAIRALGPAHAGAGALATRKLEVQAADWVRRAREARSRGELIEAHESAARAAALGVDAEADALFSEIRDELVERLHNEALVAWRDRDVDRAIRTWESLLAEVPDFEPASVYLERARRLRERLDRP